MAKFWIARDDDGSDDLWLMGGDTPILGPFGWRNGLPMLELPGMLLREIQPGEYREVEITTQPDEGRAIRIDSWTQKLVDEVTRLQSALKTADQTVVEQAREIAELRARLASAWPPDEPQEPYASGRRGKLPDTTDAQRAEQREELP